MEYDLNFLKNDNVINITKIKNFVIDELITIINYDNVFMNYWVKEDNDISVKYEDITEKWMECDFRKNNKIIMHKIGDSFRYKGKEYIIDNYNIVLDYKAGELEFASWLKNRINKKIEVFPRFNKPDNMKSTDYKIGKEYFDYKHTIGCSSQLIYHNIEKSKGQSVNFIINITNEFMTEDEIVKQLNYTFRRCKWVKKIGIKFNSKFKMYKRIKNSSRGEKGHRDHCL